MTLQSNADPPRADPRHVLPALRPGTVRRELVVALLSEAATLPLVSVVAPGGYGKTICLAQWAADEERPVAWVTLDPGAADPSRLARDLAEALEAAGLVTVPRGFGRSRSAAAFWSTLVPEVRALLGAIEGSFSLVLDDVQHAGSREAQDLVGVVAASLGRGSRLILAGRSEVTSVVAPARASREVTEIGIAELRLSRPEARALLADVGVDVDEPTADELNRRAEGWAAGLALGGLALRLSGASGSVPDPASLDRFVEDYLRVEHLSAVSREELDFLLETAVLERLSPDLCDAVRGRSDSRALLEELEAASRFVVALDHERQWYRYHDLFRATLVRELERRDASVPPRLRLRAATWCAANGAPLDAIAYAFAADDKDVAADLLARAAIPLWRAGHQASLLRWFEELDDPAVIARQPLVPVLAALVCVLAGDAFHAERSLEAARRVLAGLPEGTPEADELRGVCAYVAAMLCRDGTDEMLRDALASVELLGEAHALSAGAMWVLGASWWLVGHDDDARDRLARTVELADATGGIHAGIAARAWLALFALRDGALDTAGTLLSEAAAHHDVARHDGYASEVILSVVQAHHAALAGQHEAARLALAALHRERPALGHALPWVAVTVLLEMARASLALGDGPGARTVLVDAAEVLRRRPDLGVLPDEVARLKAQASGTSTAAEWATTLTAAELRLLPLLTTHLTFREIGERLFVSRNTVKTQAISIYRKLGASSRGEAVARATELGLVEPSLERQRFIRGG